MKKILLVFLEFVFCATFALAKRPPKPKDFSGAWMLDFGKTKDPPAGLNAYRMDVSQDQQQLKVETSLRGNLRPARRRSGTGNYPGGSPGGYPRRRGGMGGGIGMPGRVGVGMPGGGGRGRRPAQQEQSRGNVAVYSLYPQSAVYKLDGGESTARFGDRGQTDATSKAEWAKNGEVLKLSLRGSDYSGQRGGKVQLKDQWKLSEDGKSLKVDRNVKSREGSATVHLVFFKLEARPTGEVTPEPKD